MNNFEEICPYCLRARLHAKRHGKDVSFVVCTGHRMINWWTNNSYHPGNVSWRNPFSAGSYIISYKDGIFSDLSPEDIKKYYIVHPEFSFSVIGQIDPLLLKQGEKVGIFYPSVIADVEDGEYQNRRFAIVFGIWEAEAESYKWGLLEVKVDHIFSYLGYCMIRPRIDTCVYQKAKKNIPEKGLQYHKQRKDCLECRH